MAMASSSAIVTTYSRATQKSMRITESEDRDFLALSLNPLANILVAKLLNPFLRPATEWRFLPSPINPFGVKLPKKTLFKNLNNFLFGRIALKRVI